jgi:hypothetical protein
MWNALNRLQALRLVRWQFKAFTHKPSCLSTLSRNSTLQTPTRARKSSYRSFSRISVQRLPQERELPSRVRLSTGSVCEFNDLKRDTDGWRVRASCSHGREHWAANGKFALKGDKLIWTSERDVISYFRTANLALGLIFCIAMGWAETWSRSTGLFVMAQASRSCAA